MEGGTGIFWFLYFLFVFFFFLFFLLDGSNLLEDDTWVSCLLSKLLVSSLVGWNGRLSALGGGDAAVEW